VPADLADPAVREARIDRVSRVVTADPAAPTGERRSAAHPAQERPPPCGSKFCESSDSCHLPPSSFLAYSMRNSENGCPVYLRNRYSHATRGEQELIRSRVALGSV
jgi:hypothetical protein